MSHCRQFAEDPCDALTELMMDIEFGGMWPLHSPGKRTPKRLLSPESALSDREALAVVQSRPQGKYIHGKLWALPGSRLFIP